MEFTEPEASEITESNKTKRKKTNQIFEEDKGDDEEENKEDLKFCRFQKSKNLVQRPGQRRLVLAPASSSPRHCHPLIGSVTLDWIYRLRTNHQFYKFQNP